MAHPSISVVIPVFNAERTIRRAIDSVLQQTVSAHEVIVVDDGSLDDSAAMVERYGDAVTLIRQANAHAAAARNRGIDQATGQWIAFLDADDYWEPYKLQRQIEVAQEYPAVDVIAGRYFFQDPHRSRQINPSKLARWYDRSLSTCGSNAFLLGTMLWTGTVLVKRTALDGERFQSGLEPAEDRDLWIRLVSRHPTFLMSEPLATAVMEPEGISRTNIGRDCRKMLEVIDRHHELLGVFSRFFWRSYVRYRWAAIEPAPHTAIPLLIKSLLGWPAPLTGLPAMQPLGRLRRLAVLLKQSVPGAPIGHSKGAA